MILAVSFWEYVGDEWGRLLDLTIEHAQIVLMSVAIAVVIGVGLGVLTYRTERPRVAVLGVTGVFLTIPSFALFGLLISPLGLGTKPAVVALVMYALLPIVRNTITGLREVDPAIVESAQGWAWAAGGAWPASSSRWRGPSSSPASGCRPRSWWASPPSPQ